MPLCNICGGTTFRPGPGNRLSTSGKAPQCVGCRSSERHRIARTVVEKFRERDKFKDYSLVAWGEQGPVAKGWFAASEQLPAKDGEAALAARPAASVDFLLCSHVLQCAADPRHVIAEIARILSDRGLALIAYPNPLHRTKTEDWETPDPKRGGARRIIGRDFEDVYARTAPDAIVLCVTETDTVTDESGLVYILTKNPAWMRRLFQVELDTRILD